MEVPAVPGPDGDAWLPGGPKKPVKDVVDLTLHEMIFVPADTPAVEEVNVIPTETLLPSIIKLFLIRGTSVIDSVTEEEVDVPVNATSGAMLCKLLTVHVEPIPEPRHPEMVVPSITQGLVMSAPVRSQPGVWSVMSSKGSGEVGAIE